jgi:CheY-like chemotaxis protein
METILVADDNAAVRHLLRVRLEILGLDILEAADGQAALDLVRAAHPSMVVLDLDMPNLNGFEVCTQLKADEATRDIPVFILIGTAADDVQGHAFCAGADGVFAKPWDLQALCQVIAQFVHS